VAKGLILKLAETDLNTTNMVYLSMVFCFIKFTLIIIWMALSFICEAEDQNIKIRSTCLFLSFCCAIGIFNYTAIASYSFREYEIIKII
jgi:hypothetical protein